MSNQTIKYRNRYGDTFWFEQVSPNEYKFNMEGNSTLYARWGGKEGQEAPDPNDLGFYDPSGGPFIAEGYTFKPDTASAVQTVKRVRVVSDAIMLEVK